MADTGTEFLSFLKANYPEDYSKLSSDAVSDALVNAVFTKHQEQFDIWKKIPEYIRDKYNGRIPSEIMELARTDPNLTSLEIQNIEKNRPDASYSVNLAVLNFAKEDYMAVGVATTAILLKGYSQKAAQRLAYAKQIRHKLANDESLGISPEQKKQLWQETRINDRKTIKKDWCENQPEKMAVHVLKQLDRGKIDKDAALPKLDTLFKKVKEQKREKALAEYLISPQGRYQHYKAETKNILTGLAENHGIELNLDNLIQLQQARQRLNEKNKPAQKPINQPQNISRSNIVQSQLGG